MVNKYWSIDLQQTKTTEDHSTIITASHTCRAKFGELKMKNEFENIYLNNIWEHGSGEGSLPIHTKGYAHFLENFLTTYNINSVVDMGCGDWQFSRLINWGDAMYQGYDIVQSVIESN